MATIIERLTAPLRTAIATLEQRARTHGDHVEVHVRTAALWSAYLQVKITPRQVAICMALLKLARDEVAPKPNPDNPIDHAGYVAIAADLRDVS